MDWNASVSPGTAGCIGLLTRVHMETLVSWVATGARDCYVDWGQGTCPVPA